MQYRDDIWDLDQYHLVYCVKLHELPVSALVRDLVECRQLYAGCAVDWSRVHRASGSMQYCDSAGKLDQRCLMHGVERTKLSVCGLVRLEQCRHL